MRRFVILLFLFLSSVPALRAQSIPVNPKFGSVSDEEVALTRYDLDTTAAVLLLCRKTDVSVRLDPDATFGKYIVVNERWKILKEEGKKVADYEFFYSTAKNSREKITNIKVNTYNLDAEGKVVKTPMSKEYIFDKRFTDNTRRVTFTAEEVRVGSVVEVTYEWILSDSVIDNLYLQATTYPINLAVTEVSYPDYFTYNTMLKGDSSRIETSNETNLETAVLLGGNPVDYHLRTDYYKVSDVPRLRREPYSIASDSYRLGIVYDLRRFVIPNKKEQNFATSWAQIDFNLKESGYQNPFRTPFKNKQALFEAIEGLEDDESTIMTVWNLLREEVSWNGRTRLSAQSPGETLKAHEGNSADLNALLASALNSIGYTADPVLIHPRSSGDLNEDHVTASAFTAVILRVSTPDRKVYYLDASEDKCGYLNLFDSDYLVEKARWMHPEGGGEWVDLTSVRNPNTNSFSQEVVVNVDPATGLLSGLSNIDVAGYPCYSVKANRDRFSDEDEWIQDTEIDERIDISTMSMTNADKRSDTCHVHYDFQKEIDQSGDYLYIPVFLYPWHLDGAFQREKRMTPVDFNYRHRHLYRFVLNIPEGYEVEQLPRAYNAFCSAANQSNYSLRCTREDNRVIALFNFNLNTLRVPVSGYSELRSFWEGLGNAERAVIVLKKVQ